MLDAKKKDTVDSSRTVQAAGTVESISEAPAQSHIVVTVTEGRDSISKESSGETSSGCDLDEVPTAIRTQSLDSAGAVSIFSVTRSVSFHHIQAGKLSYVPITVWLSSLPVVYDGTAERLSPQYCIAEPLSLLTGR